MRILVTGGTGFIGKYLVKSLLEKGHNITIFDDFSNSTKDSISSLIDKGIKVIEGDITKKSEIVSALKDIEIVIHLAAKISVSESINNPEETFQVNVEGTKNVLAACKENHVKKIIAASSAAVYGEGIKDKKLTEELTTNPISPYGESKMRMEQEIHDFELKHGINCIILRFFNIFGIGQTSEYAGVITKFLEKIKNEQPLEIFGDGFQTRDFVSIEDIVYAINNAILYGKSGIYNIASGKATTINELAEFMISVSNKDLEIRHLPELEGDIRNSEADISLAKIELRFSPKYGLDKIKELLD